MSQSLHQHYLRGGGRTSFARNLCLASTKKCVPYLGRHKSQITNLRLRHTNTNEIWECSITNTISTRGWNRKETPPGTGIRERPPLGGLVRVLPGQVQFSHVGVFFVSCYMASRRGVARTVVGGCLEPTYIPILLTYPNRLRKDCRDGSGNQYPSRITRIRPGFFCRFQPLFKTTPPIYGTDLTDDTTTATKNVTIWQTMNNIGMPYSPPERCSSEIVA